MQPEKIESHEELFCKVKAPPNKSYLQFIRKKITPRESLSPRIGFSGLKSDISENLSSEGEIPFIDSVNKKCVIGLNYKVVGSNESVYNSKSGFVKNGVKFYKVNFVSSINRIISTFSHNLNETFRLIAGKNGYLLKK